jgi:tetratricopeptide (TPR) repeat protein
MPSGVYENRAFLAYSRRDDDLPRRVWGFLPLGKVRWASWLHRTLEHFVIDKSLAERIAPTTSKNLNPASMRPVFLDRTDFVPGGTLAQRTIDALDKSQFLIVLCSPNAAASPYVNEEVRRFKHMRRSEPVLPIIPIILSGEPGDPEQECFPPALRYKQAEDGSLTHELEPPPLAADLRPTGDGTDLAPQKVIAGLLGVPLDEVLKRAQAARRRQLQIRTAVSFAMAVLTVATAFFWTQAEFNKALAQQNEKRAIERAEESERRLNIAIGFINDRVQEANRKKDRVGTRIADTVAELVRAERDLDRLAKEEADPPLLRHRKAQVLLSLVDSYGKLGMSVERARHARNANGLLLDLVAKDGGNTVGYLQDLATSEGKLADVLSEEVKTDEALQAYDRAIAVLERIVQGGDAIESQRLMAGILAQRAGVQEFRGGQEAAREDTNRSHAILRRLVEATGGREDLTESLALSYQDVSDRLSYERKYEEAAAALGEGIKLLAPRADADLGNAKLKTGVGLLRHRLGEMLLRQGKRAEALEQFQLARDIYEEASRQDPQDAAMQQRTSVALVHIGDVLLEEKEFVAVAANYETALQIFSRLRQADEADRSAVRDEGAAHGRLGRLFIVKDNPHYDATKALRFFQRQLEQARLLSDQNPEFLDFQQDLARALAEVSSAHADLGDLGAAVTAAQESVAIREVIALQRPQSDALRDEARTAREKLRHLQSLRR